MILYSKHTVLPAFYFVSFELSHFKAFPVTRIRNVVLFYGSMLLPHFTLQCVLDPEHSGKCNRKECGKLARYSCGNQSIACGLGRTGREKKKYMLENCRDTLAPYNIRSMINTV